MIITPIFDLIFIVVGGICGFLLSMFLLRTRVKGIRIHLFAALIFAWIFMTVGESVNKEVTIVEDTTQLSSGMSCRTFKVLGHPSIHLYNGKDFSTKGMKLFSKTLINCSTNDVCLYPIVYGNTEGLPISFKRAENKKTSAPIVVRAGQYSKIKAAPEFKFVNPPQTVEGRGSFWNGIFGVADVKWCILKYNDAE